MTKLIKHGKRTNLPVYEEVYAKIQNLAKEYNYSITAMGEYLLCLGLEDVECYQKELDKLADTPVKIISTKEEN